MSELLRVSWNKKSTEMCKHYISALAICKRALLTQKRLKHNYSAAK